MNTAYFDCFCGIAGNMILGAFIDSGLNKNVLISKFKKTKIPKFTIDIKKVKKQGIVGTYLEVKTTDKTERKIGDILKIIRESNLDEEVKNLSQKIFEKLFSAEAKVHGKKFDEIHLHELSATDAIVDIVGSCIAIKEMGIEKIYSSPLNLGSGFVSCKHGTLPVPAPATLEIIKNIPIYSSDIKEELTTPTGAAIITTLADKFCNLPPIKIKKIGYGAGSKNLPIPNFLRIYLGEEENYNKDNILQIETNIDDLSPQIYDYLFERLFEAGALDVYLTPIIMKKTRPAVVLSVLCYEQNLQKIKDIIFSETTTLGVRIHKVNRIILKREIKEVNTKFGKIKVKIVKENNKIIKTIPEYEDCKNIAKKYKIPLREVFGEVAI